MSEIRAEKVWFNGTLVAWDDANVHVMTHALHYGTSWFEGIRCYQGDRGPQVFRLDDHIERLFHSCRIYRVEIPFTPEEIQKAILQTISVNDLDECYIRPLVFRGAGSIGVNPLKAPIEVVLLAFPWGRYLGEEAIEQGVDIATSSWQRVAPNTVPAMAKAGGNYLSGGLISMEATLNGFAEGVATDVNGYLSEGSGENIFLVYHGRVYTPAQGNSILSGITRQSVITLLEEQGFETVEQALPREFLYVADEIFFTGTAAEVTPVRSVDRIQVGAGKRGPVTTQIQHAFFDYVQGRVSDRHGWMTSVQAVESMG